MDFLPMFMDVRGRPVLVVGGGDVAARKVELLRAAGAAVTLVAPELCEELAAREDIEVRHERFSEEQLNGMTVAIAATDETAVNAAVAAAAERRNIPVNVVDEPHLCRFIVPSIIDREQVTVAVSTGGLSPVLARLVRSWLEAALPTRLGRLAVFAGNRRERVRRALPDGLLRRRFWEAVLDGPVGSAMLADDEAGADRLFDRALRQAAWHEPTGSGLVVLIDTGDGDPENQTLRTLRRLQSADCILYEAEVAAPVAALARRDARRIALHPSDAAAGPALAALQRGEVAVLLASTARLRQDRAALLAAGVSPDRLTWADAISGGPLSDSAA